MAKRQSKPKASAKPLLRERTAELVRGDLPPLPPRRKGMSVRERFERFVDQSGGPDACHVWRGSTSPATGYGQIRDISRTTGRPTMRSTQIVALELATGQPKPPGANALHAHGCPKTCVNPRHLRWGTKRENTADARQEGKLLGRKLTANAVRQMVGLYRLGVPRDFLRERFNVSAQTVHSILAGKSWAGITGIQYTGPRKGGRPRKPGGAAAPKPTMEQRRERVREALI